MLDNDRYAKVAQVAQRFAPHSRLLRTWRLTGGVSAQVTALELALPDGQTQKLIIRCHGERDRQLNPQIATDEYRLLKSLQAAGIAVPAPYALDISGDIFPIPYIVVEYVEGTTEFAPVNMAGYLQQAAVHLASIHQLDWVRLDLSFLPNSAPSLDELPQRAHKTPMETRCADLLQAQWPPPPSGEPVLLHGDYWPGNLLWRRGRLVAVIDWEDAQIGDPLADLANSRLEFRWALGGDAHQRLTAHYQAITRLDLTNLPYWDLYTARRVAPKIAGWGLDAKAERSLRHGISQFIAQALAALSER